MDPACLRSATNDARVDSRSILRWTWLDDV